MAPTTAPTSAPAGYTSPTSFTNPFANLFPDFSIFGTEFTSFWQKAFVGLWALCFLAAGVYLLVSLVKLHKATNNNIPGQADEAKTAAGWAGGSLLALAAFGVIIGAILKLAT